MSLTERIEKVQERIKIENKAKLKDTCRISALNRLLRILQNKLKNGR